MAYEWTGPTGPTASSPNDPNDYSGGNSGFNAWGDSLFNAIGQIGSAAFGFGSAYVTGQNQTQPGGNVFNYPGQTPPPAAPPQNNTLIYIVIIVAVLALLLGAVYVFKK